MSTHGVVIIRVGEWAWGFHVTHDGHDVKQFYQDNKHLDDAKVILENAFDEFATIEGYTDCPEINIYKEKFDPHEDHANVTEYTCYFDGVMWHTNFVDEDDE